MFRPIAPLNPTTGNFGRPTEYNNNNATEQKSSLTVTKENLKLITTMTNLSDSYGFNLNDTRLNANGITFSVDISGIECLIEINEIGGTYFLKCRSEIGINDNHRTEDYKELEKTLVKIFDQLVGCNKMHKIKLDFRSKLSQECLRNIVDNTSYDTIILNIDGILISCKYCSTTEDNNFNVDISLGDVNNNLGDVNNNLVAMMLPQSSIVKLINYYQDAVGLQFLIKLLKLLSSFSPKIINYSINESNILFQVEIGNLGASYNTLNIFFDGMITKSSNPLSHIYYIQYDNSANYIVGTNLLKLLYLLTDGDMNEYYTLANIQVEKQKIAKIPKEKKIKEKQIKEKQIKVPKPIREKQMGKRNPTPRFVREAAVYAPTRNQPYPIPFNALERTITTFNNNHKEVLRRFTNNMTTDEFITMKRSFNSNVGFTPEQTQLIQMLPDDKDYVVSFFKVYDLI